MAKYSEEFKLILVKEYEEGKLAYNQLGKEAWYERQYTNFEMGKNLREIRRKSLRLLFCSGVFCPLINR